MKIVENLMGKLQNTKYKKVSRKNTGYRVLKEINGASMGEDLDIIKLFRKAYFHEFLVFRTYNRIFLAHI